MPYTEEGIKKINKLVKGDWIYAGGDYKEHLNYWKIFSRSYGFIGDRARKFKPMCVCGQELQRNCWIYSKKKHKIKIIGSECINKFIGKQKLCHICGEEHNNRIVNRCNDCRHGMCDICDKIIDSKYRKCYKCKFG